MTSAAELSDTGTGTGNGQPHEDAAWVRIATPLSHADLCDFLQDVERLYRINPLLEFSVFARKGPDRYRVVAQNHSNGGTLDTELTARPNGPVLEIAYSSGLKAATLFRSEPRGTAADLVVTDVYGGTSEEERRARAGEVDLSLNAWGRALHDYLGKWARWRGFAPWRWYMRRVWQPMTPSARRIVWMIWVISAFEVVALAAMVGVWGILRP